MHASMNFTSSVAMSLTLLALCAANEVSSFVVVGSSVFVPTSRQAAHPRPVSSKQSPLGLSMVVMSPPSRKKTKSSIRIIGHWYSEWDPVARPPVYDDDDVSPEFSFASPTDSWPTMGSPYYDEDMMGSTTRSVKVGTTNRPPRLSAIRRAARWILGR